MALFTETHEEKSLSELVSKLKPYLHGFLANTSAKNDLFIWQISLTELKKLSNKSKIHIFLNRRYILLKLTNNCQHRGSLI